jgi:Dyp-type peroxidase family
MPDAASPPAALPLNDLQGNVVRGYNYPRATFVFCRFVADPLRCRAWLQAQLEGVTRGTPWDDAAKPESTVNLAFTHLGLAALGLAKASLDGFPDEFRNGMAQYAADLGDTDDSAPEKWDFGGPATAPVHFLLSVHGQTSKAVADRVMALQGSFGADVATVYSLAAGLLELDVRREHFGFRDGFGQPSIAGSGVDSFPGQGTPRADKTWTDLKAGEFLLGYADESDGISPLPPPAELTKNGTFLVFRKLYQDVAKFRQALKDMAANQLQEDTPENREWIASRLVGRWRSGAPVALTPDKDDPALAGDWSSNNNFDYSDDATGRKCPAGAHIRRVNPRAGLPETHPVKTHRILRRGLTYGAALLPPDTTTDDGADRGVAFMAINASIRQQFHFVQQAWINDGDFASSAGLEGENQDPIVGAQNRGLRKFAAFDSTGQPVLFFNLPRFTRVRGGGYFFIPSLTGLRVLAAGA